MSKRVVPGDSDGDDVKEQDAVASTNLPPGLKCPVRGCNIPFRDATVEANYCPMILTCGHNVCGACFKAVMCVPEPLCPICSLSLQVGGGGDEEGKGGEVNALLGWYGEAVASGRVPPTPEQEVVVMNCVDCLQATGAERPSVGRCKSQRCNDRPLCRRHLGFHEEDGHDVYEQDDGPVQKPSRFCSVPGHTGIPLGYFCKSDNTVICAQCCLDSHPPSSHTVVKLDEVMSPVLKLLDKLCRTCHDGAVTADTNADIIKESMTQFTAHCTRGEQAFEECWAEFMLKCDNIKHIRQSERMLAIEAKDKQLTSQYNELVVRSGQLLSVGNLGRTVMKNERVGEYMSTEKLVEHMLRMNTAFDGPVVDVTGVGLHVRSEYVLPVLTKAIVLKRFSVGIGAGLSELSGSGLTEFVCGDASANVIDIVLKDVEGKLLSEVTVDDVVFDAFAVRGDGSDGGGAVNVDVTASMLKSVSVELVEAGHIRIVYDVFGVESIGLRIEVGGNVLSGAGSWVIVKGTSKHGVELAKQNEELTALRTENEGLHSRVSGLEADLKRKEAVIEENVKAEEERKRQEAAQAHKLTSLAYNKTFAVKASCFGMAVNSAETKMAIVGGGGADAHKLGMYSLPDGALVNTIGALGSGDLQFYQPSQVCFGPEDSVLVADHSNSRVQELTPAYAHKRHIAAPSVWSVCCNATMIGIGTFGQNSVLLHDYASGTLLRTLTGPLRGSVRGIRFSADGSELIAVCESNDQVHHFNTATAAVIKSSCGGVAGKSHNDLCQTNTGEIVVSDYSKHKLHVFAADGGSHKFSIGTGVAGTENGQFSNPAAIHASASGKVYVLDRNSPRVQVFHCVYS